MDESRKKESQDGGGANEGPHSAAGKLTNAGSHPRPGRGRPSGLEASAERVPGDGAAGEADAHSSGSSRGGGITGAGGDPDAGPAESDAPDALSPSDIDALTNAASSMEGGAHATDGGAAETGAAAHGESADAAQPGSGTDPLSVARPFEIPDLGDVRPGQVDAKRVTMLNDVKLRVRLQLGSTHMLVEDVLKLGEGSVVELDKLAGDPVDVLINDRLIARGEVLVLNDVFCVRVSEVLAHDPHRVMT